MVAAGSASEICGSPEERCALRFATHDLFRLAMAEINGSRLHPSWLNARHNWPVALRVLASGHAKKIPAL